MTHLATSSTDSRLPRLEALQRGARHLADPSHELGRQARELLCASTGLSPQGVDYALRNCLEHRVGRSTWSQLVRRRAPSPRAHVLLSANVFTAAFRAIGLALTQSPHVFVRPSRREPEMAQLLCRASGGAFELVDSLSPEPPEPFWAYGTDETLAQIKDTLPGGVRFHAHGSGMGVAVFGPSVPRTSQGLDEATDRLAMDVVAFDQRGCLSPRVVLVEGDADYAGAVAHSLARAFARWEQRVPRGKLTQSETADFLWYRDTMTYAAEALPAGKGLIVRDPVDDRVVVPPIGRVLHVTRTDSAEAALVRLASRVVCVGMAGDETLEGRLRKAIGERRYVPLGAMQTPPLDGPVDLRAGWEAEIV
ncbi:MAG: hypothetical protein GX607_03725 [Myxococcales bacterium]|jgi:hypothetical protein|nr:hypothetical protein [Myxococcales bacterium]